MRKTHLILSLFLLLSSGPVWACAWTFQKGKVWTKLTFMTQDTNDSYIGVPRPNVPRGERAPNLLNGEYRSRTFFFDAFYGITDNFNIGIQVPFFNQTFEDDELTTLFGGPVSSTGFSDIRVFLKHKVTNGPVVSSLKFGFKAPTGKFENTQGLIPVGEGQWDFDFILQVGRSFWPFRGYANVDAGYRLRMKNTEVERDPGDEFFWIAEFGYQWTEKWMTVVKYEGIRGQETTSLGLQLSGDVKKIQYISPAALFQINESSAIEAGIRFSISGQNFPAGPVFQVGLNYQGSLLTR